MRTEKLYFGAAYYAEYMPEDRVDRDMELMAAAGMNLIRVAESAWSTWEPREGRFDFSLLKQVISAARDHGISVIVGTPTYAIPPWLARKYPDILAETHDGPCRYGHRQNMDLTHPGYRRHCEIILRRLMEAVMPFDNVIGFQLDNETKPYDTCGERAQALFKEWLREKFGTVEAMNRAYGLAYWSNALGSWDDLPDVRGTINGSLAAEYESFQRDLVTQFLSWQASILDQYRKPHQFLTHNFDYEWHGFSYGLQPDADQFRIAGFLTVAGCDIYHPSGDDLTGAEISLGGDIARGLKNGENYLVLETQAQGPMGRLPHPGQLRLQGLAHLANGANCVEYWPWHSIHNAIESHWKGVLSHDLTPAATYEEAASLGRLMSRLSPHLVNLKRTSPVGILVSQRALAGVKHSAALAGPTYNECLRWLYDALYKLNIPCDILSEDTRDFSSYRLIAAPCLYTADEGLISALRGYVHQGGCLLGTFRSFFADGNVTIRHAPQPYGLTHVFGMTYDTFAPPKNVPHVSGWMELLRPDPATEVLDRYDHPAYESYAAATCHPYGRGWAAWLGAMFDEKTLENLLLTLLPRFGIRVPRERWPLVVKEGTNGLGKRVRYLLNYSPAPVPAPLDAAWTDLLTGASLSPGHQVELEPWGAAILEEP